MLLATAGLAVLFLQTASTPINPATLAAPAGVQAVRLDAPITLDGVLNDPAWARARVVSGFRQRDPDEGQPATLPTEVRLVYDDATIYVGARLYDTAPDSIVARLARRDNWVVSDRFLVFLDPYLDRRTGFFFGVNAAGTMYDGTMMNDDWDNDTWDGIWDARVQRDSAGWTAELRIPYSQLRFRQADQMIWGVNFKREVARRNESSYLSYPSRSESGFVSRFPTMSGLENIRPPRRLELTPYVTSRAEFLQHKDGDPFNDGSRFKGTIGADLKLGLGSNLTLDATVNPDFGQVEVDPAVVNLSDVETFFPEKRPFFIEGASIFDFGFGGANNFWGFNWPGPDFFYSRRIGRPPQGGLPTADYADVPEGATILGAAKLSGKVAGTNVGLLSALTDREHARLSGPGGRSSAEVEPLTSYNVLRAQREFSQGRRSLGILATGMHRDLSDPTLDDQLNRDALSLGVDGWTFLDRKKVWVITGWTGATHVSGSQARITSLQQNSTHYFQRPDADHVSVDGNATSLDGWAGRMSLNKQQGEWQMNAAVGAISPGFETNDVGFLSRTDIINGHVVGTRRWNSPGRLFRLARVNTGYFRTHDFSGLRTGEGIFLSGGATMHNYHEFGGFFAANPDRYTARQTRGGPAMLAPGGWEGNLDYATDSRKPVILSAFGYHGSYSKGSSNSWSLGVGAEWKPASTVSLRVSPNLEWSDAGAQYVGAYDDLLATTTFGRRYVFATLRQTTVSSSVRLNWTFSPSLSLELYAQPLVSSGDYRQLKELRRRKSFDFLTYGEDGSTISPVTDSRRRVTGYTADPDGPGAAPALDLPNLDFSFASLRGNAVLRWEYLPGSTLFLVWTQDRSDFIGDGEFSLGRSLQRLGRATGNHIFAVKLSYWWHP